MARSAMSLEEQKVYRQQILESLEKRRALAAPMDFDWAHPILTDPILERMENEIAEMVVWSPIATLVKQAALRSGRKALLKIFEGGSVDCGSGYRASGHGRDTDQGLVQLAYHAFMMACFQHVAQVDVPGDPGPGIFELAGQMFLDWAREPFTLGEMCIGMCLEVGYTEHLPYKYLQAWEKVHIAMRALPGVSLSKPARVSLARLVYDWTRASRPYTRVHEIELMSQIDLYSRIELRVGGDEQSIAELYEITSLYHRKRVLEAKKRTAPIEREFVEIAPMLGILGGAIPRASMFSHTDRQAVHAVYGPGDIHSDPQISLDWRGEGEVPSVDPSDPWAGVR